MTRDQILKELQRQGRSQSDLARAIGTDPGTLRRILLDPFRVRLGTWVKIADALGLDLVMCSRPQAPARGRL